MKLDVLVDSVQSNRVNITHHAREEAKNDSLQVDDILHATCDGEIIENYPTDTPFPSCLIYGKSVSSDPIHCVWAYDSESEIAILITVYRPDPDLWINWKERK